VIFSGQEVFFDREDLIVSKTDIQGRITYANRVFMDIAGYVETELLGVQHNIVRHKNMPRSVFDLLWSRLAAGHEVFAYVVNRTKDGNFYWVIAHVTPSKKDGNIVGYHSTRRVPNPATIQNIIIPLYDQLIAIEAESPSKKAGLRQSAAALEAVLVEKGVGYDEFVAGLTKND
jgi:PAS domain S-box-containing protein